jgi:hypothetical protein
MTKDLSEFADELVEETLSEAAETFFGRRKGLEDAIEVFESKVETLEKMEAEVLLRAGDLHYLLLEGEAAADFYKALGTDPAPLLDVVDVSEKAGDVTKPRALTRAGGYAKMVARAYRRMHDAVEMYMEGAYVTGDQGKKHLTLNYRQLRQWCEALNDRIEKVNRDTSPSETLAFVKKLDTVATEKVKFTGGGSQIDDKLDKDMAFKRIDCEHIDLIEFPELPRPEDVDRKIKKFCKSLAREHKDRIVELMQSV